MKTTFISFIILFISFFSLNAPASASDRKLKIVTDQGAIYEQPCPDDEGVFEIFYEEKIGEDLYGKDLYKLYSMKQRCYQTVRLEVGAWLPIWDDGFMATGGISGGMQLRLEPEWSLRLAGGVGAYDDSMYNGITWYASATARYHVPGDILRIGLGLGLTQQHRGLDSLIQDYLGGGVVEAELEIDHHFVVNGQLGLGVGGLYNQPTGFAWGLNLVIGYRF